MNGFNHEYEHIYNIPSNQMRTMGPNYTNNLPLNQTIVMDSGYTNMHQPNSIDFNDIYSCQDPSKAFYQPPSQVSFPSGIGYLDNNNVYTGGNELMNTMPYGYVENNDLTGYISPSTYYPPPQTSVQTQSTSIPSNNAGMKTNTRNHVHVVIIMNADFNLEKLLSVIQ